MMKMLLKRFTVIMTIFALFIAGGGRVLAEGLTGEDLDAILKDAPIHQTIGTGAVCGNDAAPAADATPVVSVDLSGNDNAEKTFRFFRDTVGLSAEQAAGITGNALAESGINPKSRSGLGYQGIFQWDGKSNGRFAQLTKWTTQNGKDPNTLEGQLAFAQYEAQARGNIEGIKKQPSVDLAAWYWGRFYEVAIINGSTSTTPLTNVQSLSKRIQYAKDVYGKYVGSAPESSPYTPQNTPETAQCTFDGQATIFVDGFVVYNQYDPAWKNKPYSTSTIGDSGCGPSAMAMAITNLTGQKITPVETSEYAASIGMYIAGTGSSWDIVPKLAQHWGMTSEPVGKDINKIKAALQKGGLVVTSGKGGLPFTSGGHYIVIRGITAEGKFKVGDSGHVETNNQEWDPEQLIQSTPGGSAYAVYKAAP